MTEKSLSQQICEECGIKPEIIEDYDSNEYELYPDFENNNNKLKLIDLLIENDHFITMSKYFYYIGNGDTDFINDFYNEQFEVQGDSLLEALYNYLTRWILQYSRFQKEDGTMSELTDTPYTLQRRDCYYKRGFDKYLRDIKKLKKAIRETNWEV